ncbi:MAG: PBP1A family penicillin-binding protein [Parcubacteria group bacterium]|nr:PBP1A family penicillin-binding protein [Parcubacteria group bacterium]
MPIPHFKHSRSWGDQNSRPRYSQRRIQQNKAGGAPRRKLPSFKRGNVKAIIAFLIPYALIAAALGILFGLALFAWYSRNLPTPDKIIDRSVAQSTKIYDRTGEHLLYEAFDTQRRTIIPLEQIPEYVKQATILVEDQNFYNHKGFDIKGIIRAVVKDVLTLSKAEGGSTLTQQLVKNALLTNEKALARKTKELVLAYQIERKFDKDQILQLYFNEIPYGSNAYGIESASQFYFSVSAKDLTIAQGATLAALPKAPTYYSPYGSHVDELEGRKNYIIGLLEEAGSITKEQADAARNEALVFTEKTNLFNAPHFVIWVREQLAEKYGEREVEQGGLRVTTTLDWDMQQAAEAAVAEFADRNAEQYNATNASLIALDPKNGNILAMVGSRDYANEEIDGNFNVAIQGARQPGSSFKPFVYAVGFEKGYTDKTTLWDVVTEFGKGADNREYVPHNYDLQEHGPLSVRAALQGSINVPAVKMLYLVGPASVIKKAEEIGYTTLGDPDQYGLSLVLGGAEVKLIEHTAAFAMLANDGITRPTVSILKVEDARGKVLEEYQEEGGTRVMEEQVVRLLSDVLSDNNARAYVFGANNYLTLGGRPVAAKTGTTNDYRDAWAMGYTPQLAAGVWVGNSDFSEMKRGADGSVVAAPIWNRFMRDALADKPVEYFPKPEIEYPDKPVLAGDLEGGTPVRIDRASGLLATELTPESFIEEKIFRTGHSILYYVNPADPAGPAPANENERDPAYPKWEVAVERWMAENDWKADEGEIPTEYDNLHVFENKPSISIIEPSEGQTVSNDIIFFRVVASAPRGISRVEFYVDDELAAESRNEPYAGRYIPNPSVANGFHALKAIAYDDIDNSQTATVNFNLLLEKTSLPVAFAAPKSNAVFSEFDFPVAIELTLPSADIAKLELFAAPKAKPSQYALIRTLSPNSTTVKTTWDAIPQLGGDYEIYAVLWDSQNTPHRVSGVDVTIDVPETSP